MAIVELLRISLCWTICWMCAGLALVISSSPAMLLPASLTGCGDLAKFLELLGFVVLFVMN